jgi:uncharacterized protein (DUF1330 family)
MLLCVVKALARPIAEKFGGEYLVRGGELRVDDDDLGSPTRLVIISFPDLASANAFLDSDEYLPVEEMRRQYAKSTVVIVDGGMPSWSPRPCGRRERHGKAPEVPPHRQQDHVRWKWQVRRRDPRDDSVRVR